MDSNPKGTIVLSHSFKHEQVCRVLVVEGKCLRKKLLQIIFGVVNRIYSFEFIITLNIIDCLLPFSLHLLSEETILSLINREKHSIVKSLAVVGESPWLISGQV